MNILLVSGDSSVFVEGSDARARMREYADACGEVHLLAYGDAHAKKQTDGALSLYPFRGSKLLIALSLPGRIRGLVTKHKIDLVSAQDPFEYGWCAKEGVKGTNAKLHIQVHTDFLSPWFTRSGVFRSAQVRMPFLNKVRRMLADRVLPHADGIRVVSNRIASALLTKYRDAIPAPIVLPIATEIKDSAPAELPPHKFSFVFITVGRLEPEKRIEDIIFALARIAVVYPAAGLVVVGSGREQRRLERLAKSLGLTEKVVFAGARTDVLGLMRGAQAYIQASAYEGYGRTLIEAALAKIPIITTDVGIVGEVFSGYEAVLATPVADPAALATHMMGIIEDHQARSLLTMNAERAAQAHLALFPDQPALVAADFKRVLGLADSAKTA